MGKNANPRMWYIVLVNNQMAIEFIKNAFRQVRPIILEGAGKVGHISKNDGSPVTPTDVAVEKKLQELLASIGVPVFGEESGYDDKNLPEACWLIDPIDGTKNFIAHSPTFTSMAVLIKNGEALAAVIYNPSTDDMFTAIKGEGAFKNSTRLHLATTPMAHVALCKEQFINELNDILQPKGITCQDMHTGGGYGFTQVAEGSVAARFQLWGGGYTHDYAPGALLVREAGGIILPILDKEYTFTSRCFVACHPDLEQTIRPHLPRLRELELQKPAK